MAPMTKNPVGTCPACDAENVPLGTSVHLEPGLRVCPKCKKAASNAAGRAREKDRAKPQLPRLTMDIATGASMGRAVVLSVTCHELDDVRRVLSAVAGLSVAIGLEAAP